MARLADNNDISILKIKRFLGLNENPDGDTTLKNGEMAEMRNFRITQDNHLQIRPGTKTAMSLHEAYLAAGGEADGADGETRLHGVWQGTVGGYDRVLAAYGGYLFALELTGGTWTEVGQSARAETGFFGFGGKAYLLNGQEYKSWSGVLTDSFTDVEGYVPLIQTATTPDGEGTLLEAVNRLTGKRRVEFSPDGNKTVFQLPEQEVDEVLSVTVDGEAASHTDNLEKGTVTVTPAPAAGTNTMEITYRKGEGARSEVTGMRFSELFNGSVDTRVFLYGDGSNKTIYSGVEYKTGQGSAEYFPDLYEAAVGEANTPITALVRHHSRLMAYKPNSAWVISYSVLTMADSTTAPAFYVQPVNRQFGNDVPGQVRLLENNPLTLDAGGVYQWRSTSTSGNISSAENNAKRISDRVSDTMRGFDFQAVRTFNLKREHEYWFLSGGTALILNYANDTWYRYEGLPFDRLLEVEGGIYGFADDGRVLHFSRTYRNDDGEEIDCYAATGAMDFDRDWLVKYSPMLFVAMQPESNARVYVTVETNRRSDYPEKPVAYSLATFNHVNFAHFSFSTNRKPQVRRVRMKVKKATFYRLIFKSCSASATATVIETDIKLRYAGDVK